ncbi:uncharacterized protein LACBIDRAFT_321651 [Laccaria bicolor S238N-H82]|uniref:Predicted protein n=1 Tax=Laccaria bicolor (strain S238N-H82 / ATCC MYA-4686) TaxID=486041 RepID=B0CTN9_LACBS|nr:uncharacterized protein LACBIDRAFT_321651 [Laccaria bicolor S238N-H82]EDR14526.1 predicted protein [Laccaria bicolor S238N-H82]|eukprot:XP_001875085.1 predicted protein [Laccaria bicolor S238N-H82]
MTHPNKRQSLRRQKKAQRICEEIGANKDRLEQKPVRGLREVTKIPINLTTKRFAQLQVATTRFKEEQNVELSSVDVQGEYKYDKEAKALIGLGSDTAQACVYQTTSAVLHDGRF